jgi:hypothetical protein
LGNLWLQGFLDSRPTKESDPNAMNEGFDIFNGLQVYLVASAMLWLQSRCQPETLFGPT